MFDDDEDGGKWIPSESLYYVKLFSTLHTKWRKPFKMDMYWLQYAPKAAFNGLKPELIEEENIMDIIQNNSFVFGK
jgi:hypothetical protein